MEKMKNKKTDKNSKLGRSARSKQLFESNRQTPKHQISKPIPVTVKKIIQENYRTKTFITDCELEAQPGQFVMIWHPQQAERPFSITSTKPFSFTVSDVGPFSHFLNTKIEEGGKIWYRGPLGDGSYRLKAGVKVLLTGGCGCVPLYHLALHIKEKDAKEGSDNLKDVMVIIGAQNKKELLFVEKFKKLGVKVEVATDDGSAGFKGYGLQLLEKLIEQGIGQRKKRKSKATIVSRMNKIGCVYSCGPEPMLKSLAEFCDQCNIQFQISLEGIMKCGFGVCGACARAGRLVCKEGPVFDEWLEK